METTKKRGRPKKKEVSKKTAQRRVQRERAIISQKQSVKQSVVVNVGDTKSKRKSTPRKKGTYQQNIQQPTIIQSPQVDYTPLILALNRTPNPIHPPIGHTDRTPLSVAVQTTEQALPSSSPFVPVPPSNPFVSNAHFDRRNEVEPQAEVDYGFGNQQFIPRPRRESIVSVPKPRSESVISDLSEDSDSGFSIPSNISELRRTTNTMRGFDTPILSRTPVESQSLQTYEKTLTFDDQPKYRQRSISGSTMSIPLSAQPPILENELPVQEQAQSAQSSLISSEPTESTVSTRKSSVASRKSSVAKGAEELPKETKLGRPVLYSGSSVESRVQPNLQATLTPAQKQESEIQALKKTFANYEKSNRLDRLKRSEIQDLLIRKGNKSRIDTLAKAKLINKKQFEDYYSRFGYVSRPQGLSFPTG